MITKTKSMFGKAIEAALASADKVIVVIPEDTTYLNEREEALVKLVEIKTRGEMMQGMHNKFMQATVEVALLVSACDVDFTTVAAPPSRASSVSSRTSP